MTATLQGPDAPAAGAHDPDAALTPPGSGHTAAPTRSGVLVAALLATLERPGDWAIALAGFLARGGLLAFLLPIVTLPTPAAAQTMISPLLVPFVFGQPSPGLTLLLAGLVGAALGWLVVGGLVGAWSDRLLLEGGSEPDAVAARTPPAPLAALLTARLLSHVPLALALAWGAARIVETAYTQLLTPLEVSTPLALRIAAEVPDALLAVGLAWLLGEAAAGIAVREVVLAGRSPGSSALVGWTQLARRPVSSAATIVATVGALALLVAPAIIAAAVAWAWLRMALFEGESPVDVIAALGVFVGLWLGGLALAGVAAAFRSAAWTGEWRRRRRLPEADPARAAAALVGTIGGSDAARPGGWPSPGGSGTL